MMEVERMAKKGVSVWAKIGVWSFIIGLVIALIFSFFGSLTNVGIWTLVILGLIVGFLNIADSEVELYLIAGIAFIITAGYLQGFFSGFLSTFMNAIVVFTAPGVLVVSFKALYNIAKK